MTINEKGKFIIKAYTLHYRGGALKTREWKTRHHVARVENVGVENVAPSSRGGKGGSGTLQGRIQRGRTDAPNAANIRPNAKLTSLKYIEHNVIFHPFQTQNKELSKTDNSAVSKHLVVTRFVSMYLIFG